MYILQVYYTDIRVYIHTGIHLEYCARSVCWPTKPFMKNSLRMCHANNMLYPVNWSTLLSEPVKSGRLLSSDQHHIYMFCRSASPINGFMILNRLGLNDLVEPINKNLEFQLQDPFLLYKNSQGKTHYPLMSPTVEKGRSLYSHDRVEMVAGCPKLFLLYVIYIIKTSETWSEDPLLR